MKLTDKLSNKFGADKVLHFAIGALISSLLLPFGFNATGISLFFVIALSVVKEKYFDDHFDVEDVFASILGSMCIFFYAAIVFGLLGDI